MFSLCFAEMMLFFCLGLTWNHNSPNLEFRAVKMLLPRSMLFFMYGGDGILRLIGSETPKKHNQEDTSKEIYRHLINNNRIMCCIKNYIWLGIWRGIVVSWHFHGFELYHNVWVKFIPLPCNLSRMAIAHWPQGSFESSRRVIVSEGHEPHPARRFPQGQQKHNANYPVNGRNPYVWNIDVNYFVSKLGMTSFQCKICSQNLKAKNFFFFFFGIRSGWKSKAPHEVDWNWNPM